MNLKKNDELALSPPFVTLSTTECLVTLTEALQTSEAFKTWVETRPSAELNDFTTVFLMSLRADLTRTSYASDLREFYTFAEEHGIVLGSVSDITEEHVLMWREHLKKKHSSRKDMRGRYVQASVARKLSTLSSLLNAAHKRGLASENCLDLISRPKVRRHSATAALSGDEVKQLLQVCDDEASRLKTLNSRLYAASRLRSIVLYTLFSVGMRVQELCELRMGDFEVTPQCSRLHLRTKGGEHHAPIIHDQTRIRIQEYVLEFRNQASPEDFLFVRGQQTKKDTKLHRSSVFDMAKAAAELSSLTKKISPHSCRATLATLLHKKNIPMAQIQDLLNHKSIETTALYVKKIDEFEEAAARRIKIFTNE